MNDVQGRVKIDRRPAPARNNRPQLMAAAVATVTVLVVMGTIFWTLAYNDSSQDPAALPSEATESPAATPEPAPTPEPTPTPEPEPTAVETPPAPASNELSSNDWLLSPYAIIREQGNLVVTGTLSNKGAETRSATVRAFVYANGEPIGVGTGQVQDVAAGESVEVSLPSGTPWAAGNKVLLVEVQDVS